MLSKASGTTAKLFNFVYLHSNSELDVCLAQSVYSAAVLMLNVLAHFIIMPEMYNNCHLQAYSCFYASFSFLRRRTTVEYYLISKIIKIYLYCVQFRYAHAAIMNLSEVTLNLTAEHKKQLMTRFASLLHIWRWRQLSELN